MLQEKNNLSIEQIAKEYICSECIEGSTVFLAEPGKSVTDKDNIFNIYTSSLTNVQSYSKQLSIRSSCSTS